MKYERYIKGEFVPSNTGKYIEMNGEDYVNGVWVNTGKVILHSRVFEQPIAKTMRNLEDCGSEPIRMKKLNIIDKIISIMKQNH